MVQLGVSAAHINIPFLWVWLHKLQLDHISQQIQHRECICEFMTESWESQPCVLHAITEANLMPLWFPAGDIVYEPAVVATSLSTECIAAINSFLFCA